MFFVWMSLRACRLNHESSLAADDTKKRALEYQRLKTVIRKQHETEHQFSQKSCKKIQFKRKIVTNKRLLHAFDDIYDVGPGQEHRAVAHKYTDN